MSEARAIRQPDGGIHERTLWGPERAVPQEEGERMLRNQGPSDGAVGDALVALGGFVGRAIDRAKSGDDDHQRVPGIIYEKKRKR